MLLHTSVRVAGPVLLVFLTAISGRAQDSPIPRALFTSQEPLRMTLRADFDEIRDNRNDTIARPGTLLLETEAGPGAPIELKLWVRGNFRRQKEICSFPPIRLDFDKEDENLGIFSGQNRVKMVVHCRDNDDFEQYILKEYIAYRIFNLITDESFRVRLVHTTYVDEAGEREPETRWSFLLEDDDDMAERLGGEVLDLPQIDPLAADAQHSGLVALFQYMIGNTDESTLALHNTVPIKIGDREYRIVPYDFDWSGLVSARYARPDERLPISNVRQRLYRGFCRAELDYGAMYALFNERRPAIETMIREVPGLDEDNRERVLSYLEGFYRVITDPKRAERDIESECRG
ncbi:MAG: hypothetical protein ACREL7_16895 [Longimicrobiales bacterium]